MEAKMLHSAVSSKPMTKHRDGERSAVRTLDKTCRSVLFVVGGEKKPTGKRRSSHWRGWLAFCFVLFFGCAVFFEGGGEGEGNTNICALCGSKEISGRFSKMTTRNRMSVTFCCCNL